METLYKSITAMVFVGWLLGTIFLKTEGAIHLFLGIGIFALANGYFASQARKRRLRAKYPLLLGTSTASSSSAFAMENTDESQWLEIGPMEGELSTNITHSASSAEEAKSEILQNISEATSNTTQFRNVYCHSRSNKRKETTDSIATVGTNNMESSNLERRIFEDVGPKTHHRKTHHIRQQKRFKNHLSLRSLIYNSGFCKPSRKGNPHDRIRSYLHQNILFLKAWGLAKFYRRHPRISKPNYPGLGTLPSA
jgi:hypothetical protein